MRLHKCVRRLQGWARIYIVIQLVVTVTVIFLLYSKTSIQQSYHNLIQNGHNCFHTNPETHTVSDEDVLNTRSTDCKCQNQSAEQSKEKLIQKDTQNKTIANKECLIQPFVLVAVFSTPSAFGRRNSSRNTWMKEFTNTTEVVFKFVIGLAGVDATMYSQVKEEDKKYKDLLLFEEHKEGYGPQCTEKLLLTMQWASSKTKAVHLMKTDHDCYVRFGCILDILQNRTMQTNKAFLCGTIAQRLFPTRKGKWVEHDWKLTKEYPPFPFGSGYVLPLSLVKSIVDKNNLIPLRKLRNEDVTLGVWVASYNIDYINLQRYYHPGILGSVCPASLKDQVIIHCDNPTVMYKLDNCAQKMTSCNSTVVIS